MKQRRSGTTFINGLAVDLATVVFDLLPDRGSVEVQRDPPGREHPLHTHPVDEILHIVTGSLAFQVDGAATTCQPGDRILLPAQTSHASVAGPQGCVYVIATR